MRIGSRRRLGAQPFELAEHLRDAEVDEPVGCGDAAPRVLVVVDTEGEAARAGQDGVEQLLARLEPFAVEARPLQTLGEAQRAAVRRAPQDRRARRAIWKRRPEGSIEHDRCECTECRVGRRRREERLGERGAARRRSRPQWSELLVGHCAECLDQTGVDLRLRQRAGERFDDGPAEVEHVLREVEVEERRLVLLVLRLGRQHIVGESRRLRHGDVDDDEQLERPERLTHALAVGDRVRGVARLDEHGAVAGGVVGEDLVGDDVARHEARDDLCAHDGCGLQDLAAFVHAADKGNEARRCVLRAGLAEVPREQPYELLEVAAERGVERHLHTEVFEDGHARGSCDATGRAAQQFLVDAADAGVVGDRDRAESGRHVVVAARVLIHPAPLHEALLDDHGAQGGEAPGIGAGLHLEVEVGEVSGLGLARIDHDHRALGVGRDLLKRGAGVGHAV